MDLTPDSDPDSFGLSWLFADEAIGYSSIIPLGPGPENFGLDLLFSDDPQNNLVEEVRPLGTPDFTIAVNQVYDSSYSWQVHSSVLSRHSAFFNSVVNRPFQEGTERKITLQDDPWVVGRMLEFMYTGKCESLAHEAERSFENPSTLDRYMDMGLLFGNGVPDDDVGWDPPSTNATIQASLYILADMYQIPGLKKYIASHLKFHSKIVCFTIFTYRIGNLVISRDSELKDAIGREIAESVGTWWKEHAWVRNMINSQVDLFLVTMGNLDSEQLSGNHDMLDAGKQLENVKKQVYKRFNVTDDEWLDIVHDRDSA